eukprot:Lankesteria_metandrocarpae@DN4512_c0_g1_i1.p1
MCISTLKDLLDRAQSKVALNDEDRKRLLARVRNASDKSHHRPPQRPPSRLYAPDMPTSSMKFKDGVAQSLLVPRAGASQMASVIKSMTAAQASGGQAVVNAHPNTSMSMARIPSRQQSMPFRSGTLVRSPSQQHRDQDGATLFLTQPSIKQVNLGTLDFASIGTHSSSE